MATLEEQTALLNQLQSELNSVVSPDNIDRPHMTNSRPNRSQLETTGRLFAAANANPKVPPTAQKERLKRLLPTATDRFHDNLDQLETQLHTARLVLCRDLAVCRERDASQVPPKLPTPAQPEAAEGTEDVEMNEEPAAAQSTDDVAQTKPEEDAEMEDVKAEPVSSATNALDSDLPESTSAVVDDAVKPTTLSIDTSLDSKPDQKESEEVKDSADAAPETANTDLDSLFNATPSNGANSAVGDRPVATAGSPALDNNEDKKNDSGDIDFGSFDADNDNISSLLPGIQDYAGPDGAEAGANDFDDIFITDIAPGDGIAAGEASGDASTFDFEAFMSSNDFGAGATTENGTAETAGGANDQFDFDALFK